MKITSIPQLFEAVSLAIFTTSSYEEIQKKLSVFGATPKYMQTGSSLLAHAETIYNTQEQHYHDARRMSLQLAGDSDAALDNFKGHVAIARAAFRKEAYVLDELKITKVSGSLWKCTQQAKYFYDRAPQYMEELKQFGATEEAFQQNKAAVEALLELKAQRMKKKGDAENSTQEKNQVIKDLRAWYGEFRKLARIAFKDNPQVLESFGMVVSTQRKKRLESPVKE
jgi:hypothetical protein